jgi:hypothetical protein
MNLIDDPKKPIARRGLLDNTLLNQFYDKKELLYYSLDQLVLTNLNCLTRWLDPTVKGLNCTDLAVLYMRGVRV